MVGKEVRYIRWFSELNRKNVSLAGVKGANLAESYNAKLPVPAGFVITTEAYKHFISKNGLQKHIMNIVGEINIHDFGSLERSSRKIMKLIENADIPLDLKDAIIDSYDVLDVDKNFSGASEGALDILRTGHEPPFIAVRSSPAFEKEVSFAGQHDSFLNVKGENELIRNVKRAFASLFTPRAIFYRSEHGILHEQSSLAVLVQKMVDSDKSGVMFSKNPVENDGNIVIEAIFGLGRGISNGSISPDYYIVSQEHEVKSQVIADKRIAFTRDSSGKMSSVTLSPEISKREVLNGHELKMLSQYAKRLEELYKKPQDVEFAISDGEISILQSRSISSGFGPVSEGEIDGNVLMKGKACSMGITSGIVKIVEEYDDLEKIKEGNILVIRKMGSDVSVALKKAGGIISEEGGMASYISTLCREMGVPFVSGVSGASGKIKDGQVVTVDGFTGRIIEGEGVEKKFDVKKVVSTKTKIKAIVDLPDYAKRAADSNVKEIGLVRLEAVVASSGKHPVWYIKNEKLDDLVSFISQGLNKMAQNFDKIWIRMISVKSNEYNNLEGAPVKNERNPSQGDHGIRFSLRNQDLFESELKAIKEIADKYSKKEFGIIVPKVISLRELNSAKKIISNLEMPKNVKIGVSIETPAAVQIINDLCESEIGFVSLDLTELAQHTLAVDKSHEDLKTVYDEMSPAVLKSIKYVARRCKKYGTEVSVVLQENMAEEMIDFLLSQGVDSISVTPDAAYHVSELASRFESLEKEERKQEGRIDENMNEEDLFLKALAGNNGKEIKDEYRPGFDSSEKEDVPSLNEAIPVTSKEFESEEDEEVIEVEEREENVGSEEPEVVEGDDNGDLEDIEEDEEVDEMLPDEEIVEESEEEISDDSDGMKEVKFEDQAEKILDEEVVREASEYESAQGAAQEEKKQQSSQGGEDDSEQVLDIF